MIPEKLLEIVERIMTMHWDMAACQCWICREGRDAGAHPVETHMRWRDQGYKRVKVMGMYGEPEG